jgi:hypothetical protein
MYELSFLENILSESPQERSDYFKNLKQCNLSLLSIVAKEEIITDRERIYSIDNHFGSNISSIKVSFDENIFESVQWKEFVQLFDKCKLQFICKLKDNISEARSIIIMEIARSDGIIIRHNLDII